MKIRVDELEVLDKQLESLGLMYETVLLPQLNGCRDRLERESAMTRTRYNVTCRDLRNKYQQELRQYYADFNPRNYYNGVCMTPPPEMSEMPELNLSGIVLALTMLDDTISSVIWHMNAIYMARDIINNLLGNASQIDDNVVSIFNATDVSSVATQDVATGVAGRISPFDTKAFKYKDKWGRVHTNYGTEAIASSMVENAVSSSCIDAWAKKVGWTEEQVSELHTAYDLAEARSVRRTDELMQEFEDSVYLMGVEAARYSIMRQADGLRKNNQNAYSGDITGAGFVHDCYNGYKGVPNSYELWGHYGYKVDELDDLETGDVVIFSDIMGLYVSNDRVILNDTSMGGISVRAMSDLEVWHGGLVGCRRVIEEEVSD